MISERETCEEFQGLCQLYLAFLAAFQQSHLRSTYSARGSNSSSAYMASINGIMKQRWQPKGKAMPRKTRALINVTNIYKRPDAAHGNLDRKPDWLFPQWGREPPGPPTARGRLETFLTKNINYFFVHQEYEKRLGRWSLGRRRREGGDGAFWDMCVKVKVDPSSHVVPIIMRILSVLETGSCRKYSPINGAKLLASQLQ